MNFRFFYIIKMAARYYAALKRYRQTPSLEVASLLDLDLHVLVKTGIKVLALDFDGVLAPHGASHPQKELVNWLKNCLQIMGQGRVFILSNREDKARARYFSEHFPGMEFVMGVRKKPYPDGLLYILEKTAVSPSELLMVDDRLLTGILAALIVGARARWLTHPVINLKSRPVHELFFMMMRSFERIVFS